MKVTTSGSPCVLQIHYVAETWPHGSSLTFDSKADAGYLHVRPSPDIFGPVETVEVVPGRLMVDVDRDGYVRGVESLAGQIELPDLLLVLRGCKWAPVEGDE